MNQQRLFKTADINGAIVVPATSIGAMSFGCSRISIRNNRKLVNSFCVPGRPIPAGTPFPIKQ
jgi:hypothetical protein